jgi:D-alanyl-D-alanine carboxypeptidase
VGSRLTERRGVPHPKKRTLAVALTLALVAALSGCAPLSGHGDPNPSTPEASPDYGTALQTQIPEVMKANAIPGAVVLVDSPRRGDWSGTFGTAQIGTTAPMSLDDSFRIGSNTKTMTSTVILQLVEEGKLALNDTIAKFRADVPDGENITIAELSEMRSGLYSYSFDPAFNATLDSDPQRAWTPDELLSIAFAHPADFAPGTRYEYSNTNIVLLGIVIEKLTGMSLSGAFAKRIFDPLKLKHTLLPAPADASLPDPHPRGYQFGTNVETIDSYALPSGQVASALDGTLEPIDETDANPSWAWAAGGAISTVKDLAVYVKALVGGGLLDKKMQKLRLDSIRPTVAGQPHSVGYGLGIAEFAPGILGHDGQLPGYSTFMVYDVTTGDTIIIGCNLAASPVSRQGAAVVVAKTVIAELYGASAVPGGDPAARSDG